MVVYEETLASLWDELYTKMQIYKLKIYTIPTQDHDWQPCCLTPSFELHQL